MDPDQSNMSCLNCGHLYQEKDNYCVSCGQKTDSHVLSVSELLSSFWNSLFNLDNTVFKTLKYVWAPWKLTSFYVEGKRKSFLNPMRLFLITLLFHFGYIVSVTDINNNSTRSNEDYKQLERSTIFKKYLDIKKQMPADKSIMVFADSLEKNIFTDTRIPEKDTFNIGNVFNMKQYPITVKDAIELPIDTVYRKYHISSFIDKIMVKQMIRLNLDRAGMIKYAIGNAAWGVLVVIGFLALFFKLLYMRKKLHYVEHLVFLMNVHSFCFIFNTIILFLLYNTGIQENYEGFAAAAFTVFSPTFLFVSMKMNYKQGLVKTLVKFMLTAVFYLIAGLSIILLVSLGSLLFF